MISTNLPTFLASFHQTTEKFIFNNTTTSLNAFANLLRGESYTVHKVKIFDRAQGRFIRLNKDNFKMRIDFHTETMVLLTKQNYF